MSQGNARVRNPVMVTLLTYVTCGIYGIFAFYSMMSELKAYLNKEEIVPWHLFVPVLGLIILLAKLPGWVTEAEATRRIAQPAVGGTRPVLPAGSLFLHQRHERNMGPDGDLQLSSPRRSAGAGPSPNAPP